MLNIEWPIARQSSITIFFETPCIFESADGLSLPLKALTDFPQVFVHIDGLYT